MLKRKTWGSALLCLCFLGLRDAGHGQTAILQDDFNRPDGGYDAGKWYVTSGAMRIIGGAAYANSSVFRVVTRRTDLRDVDVSFRLLNHRLTSSSGQSWHGAHIFLRYQSEYHLYALTFNRRDNIVIFKKKVPGGSSNGGSYYNLTSNISYPVPYGRWQALRALAKNNADGSVTLELYVDGKLLARAVDNGRLGGAPIRAPGRVGVRGDYTEFRFDDFVVAAPGSSAAPGPTPPPITSGPGMAAWEARARERFLSPAMSDGVNDVATFGPSADEVAIFDLRGREIFRRSRALSSGQIVWNVRDDSGKIVDSGVYIARILKPGGELEYQSFAVVK